MGAYPRAPIVLYSNPLTRRSAPIRASCFGDAPVCGKKLGNLSGTGSLHAVPAGQIKMDQPCPSAACIPGHCKLFLLAMKPVSLFQVHLFSVPPIPFSLPLRPSDLPYIGEASTSLTYAMIPSVLTKYFSGCIHGLRLAQRPVGALSSSPTITVSFRPVLPLMRLSDVTSTVIPGFNTDAIAFRNGSATLNRRRSSRVIS